MASHRKSIIKASLDRLEDKMAIRQSRGKAKDAARESGESIWAFSTGKIHSFKTRTTYQEHVLKFVTWTRSTYQIKSLEDDLDPRAGSGKTSNVRAARNVTIGTFSRRTGQLS